MEYLGKDDEIYDFITVDMWRLIVRYLPYDDFCSLRLVSKYIGINSLTKEILQKFVQKHTKITENTFSNCTTITKEFFNYTFITDGFSKRWFKNGKLHRDNNLPALIFFYGYKEWYIYGIKYKHEGNMCPTPPQDKLFKRISFPTRKIKGKTSEMSKIKF